MQAAQPPERIAEERARPGVLIVGRDKRVGPGFNHKQAMIEALFRVFQLDEVSGQNFPHRADFSKRPRPLLPGQNAEQRLNARPTSTMQR